MSKNEQTSLLAAQLAQVPTCTAIDVLLKDYPVEDYVLKDVSAIQYADAVIAGPVRTLRFLPTRADFVHETNPYLNFKLIDSVSHGEVLVFDTMRGLGGSVLGDMLALRAKRNGAAAVITDGAVRDLSGLHTTELPVFASRVYPIPFRGTLIAHEIDQPIQCGGALVLPTDWILADRDCVLALPTHVVPVILERATGYLSEETFSRHLLDRGESLAASYPIPYGLRAHYDHFLTKGALPSREELLVGTALQGK